MFLSQVIAAIPDMTEVFTIITARVASKPETGLLEVIGPVWCNTTRHFLLIQVISTMLYNKFNIEQNSSIL